MVTGGGLLTQAYQPTDTPTKNSNTEKHNTKRRKRNRQVLGSLKSQKIVERVLKRMSKGKDSLYFVISSRFGLKGGEKSQGQKRRRHAKSKTGGRAQDVACRLKEFLRRSSTMG